MTHPKRADAFRKWSQMMLEQALVPDRLQYKQTSGRTQKSGKGMNKPLRKRRKRFRRSRKRKQQE